MRLIGVILLISTLTYNTCHAWCCYHREITGYCYLKGYSPGGNEVILNPIEAPEATLEDHSIAQIAYYCGLECSVLGSVVDVAATMKKFEGLAAKLSASLSIWGTLLSFAQIGNPTPDDIIEAVNKALVTLTAEVNKQFTNMQGYVDQHLLDLQNEMMQLDYKSYHNYFSRCIREVTEEMVNFCMEEAERISASDYNKFMQFLDYVDLNDWSPSPADVKKMEVQFITFRDYAQLRIMMLTTLVSTYIDKSDEYSGKQTRRFLESLQEETERYIKYATFCYDSIIEMHDPPKSYPSDSQRCDDMYEQWEGGSHTRNWRKCYHKMSPMLLDSETCDVEAGVRMDGKHPSGCIEWGDNSDHSVVATAKYAAYKMTSKFGNYTRYMGWTVKNFWEPNIKDRLKTWSEVNIGAKKLLSSLQNVNIPHEYLTDKQKFNIKTELERIESLRQDHRRGIKVEL